MVEGQVAGDDGLEQLMPDSEILEQGSPAEMMTAEKEKFVNKYSVKVVSMVENEDDSISVRTESKNSVVGY